MMKSLGQRIKYIDSIKGIACIFVFLGHFYYGFYSHASDVSIFAGIKLIHSVFRFLFNGTFCVALFSFISGFFTEQIKTGKAFFCAVVKRYFRISFPLLFLCLLIVAVGRTVTYSDSLYMAERLQNSWLYCVGRAELTLGSAIKAAFFDILFRGDSSFATQLWMLRPMFIGQLLLFFYYYVDYKNYKLNAVMKFLILLFSFVWSYPCFAVICGGMYRKHSIWFSAKISSVTAVCILLFVGITGHLRLYNYLPVIAGVDIPKNMQVIFAMLTIVSINQIKKIQKVLEKKILLFLGRLSFQIYLLHTLIIAAISCRLFMVMEKVSYSYAYFIVSIITVFSVLIFSVLWLYTVEPLCKKMVNGVIDGSTRFMDNILFYSKEDDEGK